MRIRRKNRQSRKPARPSLLQSPPPSPSREAAMENSPAGRTKAAAITTLPGRTDSMPMAAVTPGITTSAASRMIATTAEIGLRVISRLPSPQITAAAAQGASAGLKMKMAAVSSGAERMPPTATRQTTKEEAGITARAAMASRRTTVPEDRRISAARERAGTIKAGSPSPPRRQKSPVPGR